MLRIHPPDILHTLIHGSMELCLGFTLQIIKLVSVIDSKNFSRAPKLLALAVRDFPAFNALQPVRHVRFENIWELYVSELSKKKGKSTNTIGLIVLKEFFKLPTALFQVMFCCGDANILPNNLAWSESVGFSEPYFNPMQVVTNAMFASLKVYWYLHTNRLTETQVVTLRMLVSNFQAHLLVFDLVRKKLIKFCTMSSSKTKSKNFVKVSSNSRSSSNSSASNWLH